eukprot:1176694-Prorocentrum_minimum.AAC.8
MSALGAQNSCRRSVRIPNRAQTGIELLIIHLTTGEWRVRFYSVVVLPAPYVRVKPCKVRSAACECPVRKTSPRVCALTSSTMPSKKSRGFPFARSAPMSTGVSGLLSCAPSFWDAHRVPLM